ncbi:MAG: amidohydrolase family protein [Bacteroidetes bacterium]|nr:amidohydrolase family protein [Bacteroidota bacterium]
MSPYLTMIFLLASISAMAQDFTENVKPYVSLQKDKYAITHVQLLDGRGTTAQKDMTIVIEQGRITQIAPSAKTILPKEMYIVDGTGKTVMPGFVMMHEHIFYTKTFEGEFNVVNMTNTFPRMYLAGGVTTMRTAGSVSPHTDLNIQRFIREGKMAGPKMDVTGPFIERQSETSIPQLPILPKEQTPGATIDYWADQGCTSFKVYMHISRQDLKEVVQHAHARGLKVTGHLCSVSYQEAAEIGIDNLEHGFMASSDFAERRLEDLCDYFKASTGLQKLGKDDPAMDKLMRMLIDKGVTITTTPAVFTPTTGYELIPGGGEEAIHPDVLKNIKAGYDRRLGKDSISQRMFRNELYWIRKFHQMGGKVVVGTDPTGAGRIIAGYGNMWTLELMVKGGFTLPEAIMLCTLNGARFLNRDKETGSLEKGKSADLILIDGDLSADATNIRKIQWVIKDGIAFESKKMFESVKGKVGLY